MSGDTAADYAWCPVSHARLPARIHWQRLTLGVGAAVGADPAAAHVAAHERRIDDALTTCDSALGAAGCALMLLSRLPLVAVEHGTAQCAVWLFRAVDGASAADPDPALEVLDAGELEVAAATGLGNGGTPYRMFLCAVDALAAQWTVRHASVSGMDAVRCAHGVLLVSKAEGEHTYPTWHRAPHSRLLQLASRTTGTSLVVQCTEHEVRLSRASAPEPETPLALLPTLARATYVGRSEQKAPRLCTLLEPLLPRGDAAQPMYTVRRGSVLLLWPASLCLQVDAEQVDAPPPETLPIETLGTEELLDLASRDDLPRPDDTPTSDSLPRLSPGRPEPVSQSPSVASPAQEAETPAGSLGAYPPRTPARDEDEDVFGGVGQLTQDDFLFFGTPGPLPRKSEAGDSAQKPDGGSAAATASHATTPLSRLPSPMVALGRPGTGSSPALDALEALPTPAGIMAPTPLEVGPSEAAPSLGRSLVPPSFSAVRSPGLTDDTARKYEEHGKFFSTMSPELGPEHKRRRLWSATPTPAPDSESESGSDADDRSLSEPHDDEMERHALDEVCLHCASWPLGDAPPVGGAVALPPLGGITPAALEDVYLAWAALNPQCRRKAPPSPLSAPSPLSVHRPALGSTQSVQLLLPAKLLVGCQHTVAQVAPTAPAFWPQLALEPAAGPKHLHARAVLVGGRLPASTEHVTAQLERVAQLYVARRLGSLAVQRCPALYQDGRLTDSEHGETRPEALWDGAPADADLVVYLVYDAGDRRAMRDAALLFRLLCSQRSVARGTVMPVPLAALASASPAQHALLALATYDAVPEAGARAVTLSPSNYANCTHLAEHAALALTWPVRPGDVLHRGITLHAAYDVQEEHDGSYTVRLVLCDSLAQSVSTRAWGARADVRAHVALVWHAVRARLAASARLAWNGVVCRLGALREEESRAWDTLARRGNLRADCPNVLDVVITCALPCSTSHIDVHIGKRTERDGKQAQTVHEPGACMVAVPLAEPLPLLLPLEERAAMPLRSAYLADAAGKQACTVHLLHVLRDAGTESGTGLETQLPAPESPAPGLRADASTYLADVLQHFAALYTITRLYTAAGIEAPLLPWHLALLTGA